MERPTIQAKFQVSWQKVVLKHYFNANLLQAENGEYYTQTFKIYALKKREQIKTHQR